MSRKIKTTIKIGVWNEHINLLSAFRIRLAQNLLIWKTSTLNKINYVKINLSFSVMLFSCLNCCCMVSVINVKSVKIYRSQMFHECQLFNQQAYFFVFCNLNTKFCVTCGTIQCIDQCTLKNTENVNWVTSSSRGWNCSKSENIWMFLPSLCFKAEIKFLYYVHIYKQSPWGMTDLKQTQMLEFKPLHF